MKWRPINRGELRLVILSTLWMLNVTEVALLDIRCNRVVPIFRWSNSTTSHGIAWYLANFYDHVISPWWYLASGALKKQNLGIIRLPIRGLIGLHHLWDLSQHVIYKNLTFGVPWKLSWWVKICQQSETPWEKIQSFVKWVLQEKKIHKNWGCSGSKAVSGNTAWDLKPELHQPSVAPCVWWDKLGFGWHISKGLAVFRSGSVRFFFPVKQATVDNNWSRTDPDIEGTKLDHLGPVFCSSGNWFRLIQTVFLCKICCTNINNLYFNYYCFEHWMGYIT